jgi:hypothetical protein
VEGKEGIKKERLEEGGKYCQGDLKTVQGIAHRAINTDKRKSTMEQTSCSLWQ